MISFTSVAVVAAVALVAPLAVGLRGLATAGDRLEILLGIVVGPQVLGWASNDEPVQVLAPDRPRVPAPARRARDRLQPAARRPAAARPSLGFALSFGLALVVGYGLTAGGLVRSPLLIAIILSATGLGIILPILKDAGETTTAVRPGRRRGRVDRRGRPDRPAVALLLRSRRRPRREARAARSASSSSSSRSASSSSASSVRCGVRRRCSGCRTRPPRSASAVPSCSSRCSSLLASQLRARGDPRRVPRRRDPEARRPRRGA